MATTPSSPTGFLGSFRALGDTLLSSVQDRMELSSCNLNSVDLTVGAINNLRYVDYVINFSSEPCVVVNAVLRHRPVKPMDYVPRARPFPYDLEAAKAALEQINTSNQIEFSI